jgi:uncharacterized protein (DUF1697 family)
MFPNRIPRSGINEASLCHTPPHKTIDPYGIEEDCMPDTYLALLRGVNVGGKNKLPMKDLAEVFAAAGCTNVRTYIQSGNVVFRPPATLAGGIAGRIAARIEERFGISAPVVLRTAEQLRAILTGNPFLAEGADPAMLHVLFLADTPNATAAAGLDPQRSPGDRFVIRGPDLYLHAPNGMGKSKLTNAYFDSKLATVSTIRNWRTVTALYEIMS